MEFYWEVRLAGPVDLLIAHFLQLVEEWDANRLSTGEKVMRRASVMPMSGYGEASPAVCNGMFITLSHIRRGKAVVSSTLCCGPAFANWWTCVSVDGNTVLSFIAPFKSGSQIKSPKPGKSAWNTVHGEEDRGVAAAEGSLGWFMWKWDNQLHALLDCVALMKLQISCQCLMMERLVQIHIWTVLLQYCAQTHQSVGKYGTGHNTLELSISIKQAGSELHTVPAVPSVAWWGHAFSHLQGVFLMIL